MELWIVIRCSLEVDLLSLQVQDSGNYDSCMDVSRLMLIDCWMSRVCARGIGDQGTVKHFTRWTQTFEIVVIYNSKVKSRHWPKVSSGQKPCVNAIKGSVCCIDSAMNEWMNRSPLQRTSMVASWKYWMRIGDFRQFSNGERCWKYVATCVLSSILTSSQCRPCDVGEY